MISVFGSVAKINKANEYGLFSTHRRMLQRMDTNTLLIILVVILLLGGGGFFYRRR